MVQPTGSAEHAGRGVLSGAFTLLDALANAEDGLGLSALARESNLAKTSTYRLAGQLEFLGAVQQVNQRYYIGARMARIGQCWQPHPLLRRAARGPVRTLAVQSGATVSLRILHDNRLRLICGTVPHGQVYLPIPKDGESTARTATGRVLYSAQPPDGVVLPDCWTPGEWRQLRGSIRGLHASVVDRQEVFPGISCVSAPVWWPNGGCAGALTAVLQAAEPTHNLRDLVVRAARRIGARLQ